MFREYVLIVKRHFREGETPVVPRLNELLFCFENRHVLGTVGLPAVCAPSRTADARNFRIERFSESSNTSSLIPSEGYTCAFDKKSACFLFLRKWCWDPTSSVPFDSARRSLVLHLPIVLLCERHRQRLRQRSVVWLESACSSDPCLFAQNERQASPEIHMFQPRSC